ncbi:MAG: hypothetical protein Q4B55_04725 [Lachnospiraceae bacterium]|nr:hypothetical protein [Lachnospiraceae bacterium]
MIDVHLHILPEVDDGSQSMEESIRMAEIALRSGTDRVIATPHCNHPYRSRGYNAEQLKVRFDLFRKELQKRGIPLTVYDGMEIFVDEQTGSLIREGKMFGLNRGKYFLLEFPFDAEPSWIDERLNEIASPNIIPLIAHVERYHCAQKDPRIIRRWLRGGCEIQVNKGSFFGVFGRAAHRVATAALENGLVTCIASDAHESESRTPWMRDVEEYLVKNYNRKIASLLLKEYPERILKSMDIPEHGF